MGRCNAKPDLAFHLIMFDVSAPELFTDQAVDIAGMGIRCKILNLCTISLGADVCYS
jgi:hypothetical protein